jgi:hypothetical protein
MLIANTPSLNNSRRCLDVWFMRLLCLWRSCTGAVVKHQLMLVILDHQR